MSRAFDEQSFIKEASLPGRHSLILYEEAEATEKILSGIVYGAMEAGMHVIYATHYDDVHEIRERLADFGVPVVEKEDLLHIVKIADPMKHPKGPMEGTKELQKILFSQASEPFLIIATLIPEIRSDGHADITSMIEEQCHENFGDGCSLVYSYDMSKASRAGHKRWLVNMLQSHHDVFFVPKAKPPTGIRMR